MKPLGSEEAFLDRIIQEENPENLIEDIIVDAEQEFNNEEGEEQQESNSARRESEFDGEYTTDDTNSDSSYQNGLTRPSTLMGGIEADNKQIISSEEEDENKIIVVSSESTNESIDLKKRRRNERTWKRRQNIAAKNNASRARDPVEVFTTHRQKDVPVVVKNQSRTRGSNSSYEEKRRKQEKQSQFQEHQPDELWDQMELAKTLAYKADSHAEDNNNKPNIWIRKRNDPNNNKFNNKLNKSFKSSSDEDFITTSKKRKWRGVKRHSDDPTSIKILANGRNYNRRSQDSNKRNGNWRGVNGDSDKSSQSSWRSNSTKESRKSKSFSPQNANNARRKPIIKDISQCDMKIKIQPRNTQPTASNNNKTMVFNNQMKNKPGFATQRGVLNNTEQRNASNKPEELHENSPELPTNRKPGNLNDRIVIPSTNITNKRRNRKYNKQISNNDVNNNSREDNTYKKQYKTRARRFWIARARQTGGGSRQEEPPAIQTTVAIETSDCIDVRNKQWSSDKRNSKKMSRPYEEIKKEDRALT
ncbi:PREDICTED: putative uncharacterized protein DDB_G0282133 [Wasmannia auropunctata]|uniref:putative uncharacterized protein DDB_G0282133 n=1 Tax=Wasmannia auropunctata TaxID=64793 RepID=UPI0005EED155|nr:PREDICTED: putative uncharacterized protein DDB_G0282133 [Wasmannia auropunctata]